MILGMFCSFLGACATATPESVETPYQRSIETPSQPIEGMINPGDKTGDFLFSIGGNDDITYSWELLQGERCTGQDFFHKSCTLDMGTTANIAFGFYDDDVNSGETLDETRSGLTYEMMIDGHPVNLQAFGSVDVTQPQVGTMRL